MSTMGENYIKTIVEVWDYCFYHRFAPRSLQWDEYTICSLIFGKDDIHLCRNIDSSLFSSAVSTPEVIFNGVRPMSSGHLK